MITAKIVQDSIASGIRIITFELEYPRFIHSEFMTHRVFSRNAASSRAIPVGAMLKHIKDDHASPIQWGRNQAGMQAKEDLSDAETKEAQHIWWSACEDALMHSAVLSNKGVHKQITNRITEPFQHMKTVVTSTEWDNWYTLRNHEDAQPEIHELALRMWEESRVSIPRRLVPGEWHVPYVKRELDYDGVLRYLSQDKELTEKEALIVSASCCAQVSYRKSDDSLEKAQMVYQRLIGSKPCHASPVEHQAKAPISTKSSWQNGYTHMDRDHNMWSGNFRGWLQHRQLLGV